MHDAAGASFFFGNLIETGSRASVFGGYLFASGLMVLAAIIEMIWGVAVERKLLEAVAGPLSLAQNRRGVATRLSDVHM